MAGIGFELRRLLRRDGLFALLRAYGLAGLVSSGPWVLSILGVLAIGVLSAQVVEPPERVVQFLVSVTWLMAASLLVTGPLQLTFSRFVADRHYEDRRDRVLPNLLGALLLTSVATASLAGAAALVLFDGTSALYRLLMVSGFVTLCDLWVLVVLLSGMKAFSTVLGLFALGYGVSVAGALLLRPWGLEGLLLGFVAGQQTMLFAMLARVGREYPSRSLLAFEFLARSPYLVSLGLTGLFVNLGTWIDKLLFWFNPYTSDPIVGPLRSSTIYDLPFFLAYLSVIPGMAVFLLRIETDFAEVCQAFYRRIVDGAGLAEIERIKHAMVASVRKALFEIVKVQGLAVLLVIVAAPRLLAWVNISPLYVHLLRVDTVAVAVQVLLLATLNVLFYLDRRREVLGLTVLFTVLNTALTLLTQRLGPQFYGYGFAIAGLLTCLVGLGRLSRRLEALEYETFMLQGS